MIVAPEALKKLIIINGVFVGDTCIRFVEEAKNLGICIDSILTFDVQVNKVAIGCHATLKQLARIKKFLTKQDLQTLVSALVLSKIDCCNSLYYKLKSCSIGDRGGLGVFCMLGLYESSAQYGTSAFYRLLISCSVLKICSVKVRPRPTK